MQKNGMNYVVPVQSIKRILEISQDAVTVSSCDDGYKVVMMEENLVAVRPISGNSTDHGKKGSDEEVLVVVEGRKGLSAFEVDEIIGQEQLRVIPLSGHLKSISGALGCTILGNGDIGIVLDIN